MITKTNKIDFLETASKEKPLKLVQGLLKSLFGNSNLKFSNFFSRFCKNVTQAQEIMSIDQKPGSRGVMDRAKGAWVTSQLHPTRFFTLGLRWQAG